MFACVCECVCACAMLCSDQAYTTVLTTSNTIPACVCMYVYVRVYVRVYVCVVVLRAGTSNSSSYPNTGVLRFCEFNMSKAPIEPPIWGALLEHMNSRLRSI